MQKLISKYGLAAHLALVAVAPLCFSSVVVVWLSALAAIWLVMEPSRIGNETLHQARHRTTKALVSDPLLWIFLLLAATAVLRVLNTGVAASYDAETGRWTLAEAMFPLLPGSVAGAGLGQVGCCVAALVVVLGCRHCLGRSARGAFALMASTLSGVWALVQSFLIREGVPSILAAAGCPLEDPSYSGCAYGVYLVCAVVALAAVFEAHWLKAMPVTLIAVGGNALGLFVFAPPAVIAAHAAAAFVVFIYAFVYLRFRLGRTTEFKYTVVFGLGVALAVLAAHFFLPAALVASRTDPFLEGAFVPAGFLETRSVLSELCIRVWKGSPWLGTGLGSFPLDVRFSALAADWEVLSPLQNGMPNGFWLLLTERGVVGSFLLAVPLFLLLLTYFVRLVRGVMLALPQPLSWVGLPVFAVAVAEMMFDCSFLLPGPAVALATALALSASAFPKEMKPHG